VEIHEIKGNATLQIPMDTRESDLVSNVSYSKIREVWFCDGLINGLILFDTFDKVALSDLFREIFVIRIARTNFERNVSRYHSGIVADGFNEYDMDPPLLGNSGLNFSSATPSSPAK
jgi:hypothetical protein